MPVFSVKFFGKNENCIFAANNFAVDFCGVMFYNALHINTNGAQMRSETRKIIATIAQKHYGAFTAREIEQAGISKRALYNFKASGEVVAISRGVFQLADNRFSPDYSAIRMRIPEGVICLISALYHHNLTTEIPRYIEVAIPRNRPVPTIDYPPVKIYRFSDVPFSAGIEQMEIGAVVVNIYSPEKTIADCFKYRNKIGIDTAVEGLRNYLSRPNAKPAEVFRMAKICRVEKVIKPYMDSLL